MKKIALIILILMISLTGKSQFYLSFGAGYGNTVNCKLETGFKLIRHSLFVQQVAKLSRRSDLPFAEWSVNYGYIINDSWQPYVGYSTQGVSAGLNKYFNKSAVFVGAGTNGRYPHVTVGVSMFKKRKYGFRH